MCPQGHQSVANTSFSLFLAVANDMDLEHGWARRAAFEFTLINQHDPSKSVRKGTCRVLLITVPEGYLCISMPSIVCMP